MLLHQLIPALVTLARRFDSVLLPLRDSARALLSRLRSGDSDLQET
jgi:hypothetical protein